MGLPASKASLPQRDNGDHQPNMAFLHEEANALRLSKTHSSLRYSWEKKFLSPAFKFGALPLLQALEQTEPPSSTSRKPHHALPQPKGTYLAQGTCHNTMCSGGRLPEFKCLFFYLLTVNLGKLLQLHDLKFAYL